MIFENQHIADERIANLSFEEAKLFIEIQRFLLGELFKLDEQKAFDDLWPISRFDFSIPQEKVKAFREFIHYLVTLNFIKNKPAMALLALKTFNKEVSRIEYNFDNFLKDEKLVYSVDEDILGKVVGESESEYAPQDTGASAEFKENFQEQLLNAVTQDSGNRAQMVLDYFDNNLGPLVGEFGMDGTELVFEILTILSEKEKERLGETSTPEVRRKNNLG